MRSKKNDRPKQQVEVKIANKMHLEVETRTNLFKLAKAGAWVLMSFINKFLYIPKMINNYKQIFNKNGMNIRKNVNCVQKL